MEETKEIGDGYHCKFSVRLALATLVLIMDGQGVQRKPDETS